MIPKQQYTTEFKKLAVTRVSEGQSAGAVAKELGLIEQTLRNWVKAAAAGMLNGAGAKVVTPEQMELASVHNVIAQLRMENESLSSNSKCNTTGPDGLRCCHVKEILSTHTCGRP